MNVGFLIFNEFEDMDLAGPWEIFGIWKKKINGPQNIFTFAEKNNLVESTKGLKIQPDFDFNHTPKLDIVVVPGGWGTRSEVHNTVLINFIKTQAENCQHILSVCTGAFLLQAAGLLRGKKAATHWASIQRLKAFKEVEVVQERFIRDGNIWTSAGISAGVDLALYFIADLAGTEIAGQVQLEAEYYPSQIIYGKNPLPDYVKRENS